MKLERIEKPAFSVIGKEGSTRDGEGFIQRLWRDANAGFAEVEDLARRDENGVPMGFWGLMSDFSRDFRPWEDFCRGLYLAGVECEEGARPPSGWTRWDVPAFVFLRIEAGGEDAFRRGLAALEERGMSLAGAVQDFTDPSSGKNYMLFPIERAR